MKSKDVLSLLKITRVTLMTYVKSGKLTATKLDNGHYIYDDDSVFKLIKRDTRVNVIYARVSTNKQRKDLLTQIDSISSYCSTNNIKIDSIFKDISSGVDFNRKSFDLLMNQVFDHKIKNIYISYPDRLSFLTIQSIFKKFRTSIVVINYLGINKSNDQELFDELINLIHHFSTQTYSKRRKNKLNLVKQDISLFN
jgi:putative resolvase